MYASNCLLRALQSAMKVAPRDSICIHYAWCAQVNKLLDAVKWDESGLVPAIAQDAVSGRVLMMAWMNRESLGQTLESGHAVYWSRSRGCLWRKGEQSGHTQRIVEMRIDCDADVVLLSVEQCGGIACHTGRESCFYRRRSGEEWVATDDVIRDPGKIYEAKS